MKKIFSSVELDSKVRASALELAIDAADRMNRFAAMDTCTSMICSVTNEDLGVQGSGFSYVFPICPSGKY